MYFLNNNPIVIVHTMEKIFFFDALTFELKGLLIAPSQSTNDV